MPGTSRLCVKEVGAPPCLTSGCERQAMRALTSSIQATVVPAGCGKTQSVKALSLEFFWKLLMLNHKEGLKDLNSL